VFSLVRDKSERAQVEVSPVWGGRMLATGVSRGTDGLPRVLKPRRGDRIHGENAAVPPLAGLALGRVTRVSTGRANGIYTTIHRHNAAGWRVAG